MKSFTKNEIIGILTILLVILTLTLFNFQTSLRRARDSQRRSDIGAISDALNKYQKDFGFYPPSSDGKILACKSESFGVIPGNLKDEEKLDYFFKMLRGCNWGSDPFRDVNDDSYEAYLTTIPADPKSDQGFEYLYLASKDNFQIFAYLEGENNEVEYRKGIVARNMPCGKNICNFGKASGETPLEKPIEEYENELRGLLNK